MVNFMEIKLETIKLNYANLKRLKIGELKEMLEEHTWKDKVVEVGNNFKLLVKYVLERKNAGGN